MEATSEKTGDGLRIRLEKGEIHINPSREEVYVEIGHLQLGADPGTQQHGEGMCWRPGEDRFELLA